MDRSVKSVLCEKCGLKIRPTFILCQEKHLICSYCEKHQNETSEVTCRSAKFEFPIINTMFENALDFCQFKCGFSANLLRLKTHEDICHKRYPCKINDCDWMGPLSELITHVNGAHVDSVVDLSDLDQQFCVGTNTETLLVLQYNRNNFFNKIFWLKYFVEAKQIIIQNLGTIGNLPEGHKKISEYSVTSISSFSPKIICKMEALTDISLLNSDTFLLNIISPPKIQMSDAIVSLLECAICLDTMESPIINCETGHSFCEKCIKNVPCCPNCKEGITESRNYVLEKMCDNVESPCKNQAAGCVFLGVKEKMVAHDKKCLFQATECVFECDWKGKYCDTYKHWTDEHKTSLKSNGTTYSMLFNRLQFRYSYRVLDNNFIIIINPKDDNYYITVYHLTLNKTTNYYFYLEFSPHNHKFIIGISGKCKILKLKKFSDIDFLNEEYEVKMPMDCFDQLILENCYATMKMQIYQKL